MSTESQLTAFALQDILLGIAGSLNDAQQTLNERPPYDAFGRPNTQYHVPHLDFNLQVTSEFENIGSGGSGSGSASGSLPVEAAPGTKFMKFSPANKSSGDSTDKTSIYSTISGRFVATVPNEGLPQTVIQIKSGTATNTATHTEIPLEVVVSNAAGEILPDSLVEYNYDEETTDSLNATPLSGPPSFNISELRTDGAGKATAIVSIPVGDYTTGKLTVVEVNVGTVVKSISLSNQ